MQSHADNEDTLAANLLHAAGLWLERCGTPAGTLAVITTAPEVTVGAWAPGAPNVGNVEIGDAEADLLDAVAPFLQLALSRLTLGARLDAQQACQRGARMQLLLNPQAGEVVMRVQDGERQVVLLAAQLDTSLPADIH